MYQPIVSLDGDIREYYSVLLRIIDEHGLEHLPSEFILHDLPVSQVNTIDHWVIQHTIEKLAELRKTGRQVEFFVTISHAGIQDENLLDWLICCLRDNKMNGQWLTFQFRCSDAKENLDDLKRLAKGLKKINCNLMLDQFTEKDDESAMLQLLPIDYVKLSPEFMTSLPNQPDMQNRLFRLHKFLQSKSIKTVALAVEDPTNLGILWNMGINYIQGYFSQRPVPDRALV